MPSTATTTRPASPRRREAVRDEPGAAPGRPPRRVDPMRHQGLVRSLALRYRGRGLDLDDLIQEGQLGLLRACELFDEARGLAFSTYAVRWIRQALSRAVQERGSLIHLPSRQRSRLAAQARAESSGNAPAPALRPKAAERLRSARLVAEAIVLGDHCLQGPTLGELAIDPASLADRDDPSDIEALTQALRQLPECERRVIEVRYGLLGGDATGVRATALRLGLGERTVRSSEAAALRRLRRRLDSDDAGIACNDC